MVDEYAATAEQWARDLMERCGWEKAQNCSSGEVVFLANKLRELKRLQATNNYETGHKDGESSLEADIECHLNENCGKPDDDARTWAQYTRWMWEEIERLRSDLGYAYGVIAFGFRHNNFDFSILRGKAEAYMREVSDE